MRIPTFAWLLALFAVALVGGGYVAYRSLSTPTLASPPAPTPAVVETVIGKSVEGRDIVAYTFGSAPTRLFFVGGMHGGYEWNSILLAQQFTDHLRENPTEIGPSVSITVIPNMNPDGLHKVLGREGRIRSGADIPVEADQTKGRFNANGVDLNRNFDCKWKPTSMWRNKEVSAGTAPFSEPESRALRDFISVHTPAAVVYWHSQANAVYASECENGILPGTLDLMNDYAKASGYPAIETFDSYPVTGDTEGWLASIGIPAITVELSSHDSVEWEQNLAGARAVISRFSR